MTSSSGRLPRCWSTTRGLLLESRPSGFSDDPDPLPDVSDLQDEEGTVNLPSVDGSMEYRAVIAELNDEARLVTAAPLTQVDAAGAELLRTVALAGFVILLLGAAATWWTVKRSLRARRSNGGDRRGHRLRRPVSPGA